MGRTIHRKDASEDAKAWAKSMLDNLSSKSFMSSSPFTICDVPRDIRKDDPSAYEPKVVSIGPFHRENENVKAIEERKWNYLWGFLPDDAPMEKLETYFIEMMKIEPIARRCYSRTNDMTSEKFVQMMVLDGFFIIHLLREADNVKIPCEGDNVKHNYIDPIFRNNWMLPLIGQDILLMENQLPFFVLECLWVLIGESLDTLRKKALKYFGNLLPVNVEGEPPQEDINHLLHLIHMSLQPTSISSITTSQSNSGPAKRSSPPISHPPAKAKSPLFEGRKHWRWVDRFDQKIPVSSSSGRLQTQLGQQSSLESEDTLSGQKSSPEPPNKGTFPVGEAPIYNPTLVCRSPTSNLSGMALPSRHPNSYLANVISQPGETFPAHDRLRPTSSQKSVHTSKKPPPPPMTILSATELQEHGVKFKKKEADNFLNVTFEHGTIEMPCIKIYDPTNTFFRNFIAFEQCFPDCGNYFTSYCFFMNSLVKTPKDVGILHQSYIIENLLGSDNEVTLLFNKLCKGIAWVCASSYLDNEFNKIIKYTKCIYVRMWTAVMRLRAILSFSAIVILILTLAQTIFTILAYFGPLKSS